MEAKAGASPGAPWESSRRQRCLRGQSVPGDHCALLRTLLQQLQKLQTLVTNKISRPYKTAATQTGTCLMVGAVPSPQGHTRTRLPQAGFLGKQAELGGFGHITKVHDPSAW